MAVLACVLAAVAAYLIGSVSFAVIISKMLHKDDVRTHGSGNAGMTNVLRTYGKLSAALTFIGDAGKGYLAVWAGKWIFMALCPGVDARFGGYIAGVFVIVGHMLPLFFKFKGGKGVATSTVIFLALAPWQTLLAAAVFGLVVWRTRMVSAGSISAAAALLAAVLAGGADTPVTVVAVIIAVLVVYKHRANIGRILRGEENRF